MNFFFKRTLIPFGVLCIFPFLLRGTYGTQEVDRDDFFRRMEARAMSLSEKMAGISGTEPIRLITPKKESSIPSLPEKQAPQQYYNALPGPPEPKQDTRPSPFSERTVPPSVVYQEPDATYYEIKPTTEELKGAFFLRPFLALQAPAEVNTLVEVSGDNYDFPLDGKVGSAVGVGLGRRLGNVEILLKLGYHNSNLTGDEKLDGVNLSLDGETEILDFSLNAGIAIPINDKLSLGASLGFGYAQRSDSSEVKIVVPPDTASGFPGYSDENLIYASSSIFSYNLGFSLDYKYSEVMSAYLGYRLVGVSENDPYEQMTLHLFELGLGANF